MTSHVHVIGAGLSGLAAAVRLVMAGVSVTVHEAANHAGGRCRSFHDDVVDRDIDNGNHLILTGNKAAIGYLQRLGAEDRLSGPSRAGFSFIDLDARVRWTICPSAGTIPWWIFRPSKRVPDSRAIDYLQALKLRFSPADRTVADCLAGSPVVYRRFWEPLAVAVLNTPAEEASAALLWPVIRQTVARGERFCRPRVAAKGLSHCFVQPALGHLRECGVEIRFGARVRALDFDSEQITGIHMGDGHRIEFNPGTNVILAVPPASAARLVPGLTVPDRTQAIVNVHFRLPNKLAQTEIVGVIAGVAQWIFVREDVASVTVSAANALAEWHNDDIARRVWPEVARVLQISNPNMPPARVIKEKRATFSQTPDQLKKRPGARTFWANLWLAGDWTDTRLPATIEGSVQSGNTAADAILASQTTA